MALSLPGPCPALLALLALLAPRVPLVASQRQMCYTHPQYNPLLKSWSRFEPGVLEVNNGGGWGDWGDIHFCPQGSYAVGIQLKEHPYQGFFGDDTGLNGVRLICDNGRNRVTSYVGPLGQWETPMMCPHGERITAFQLMVEAPRGVWDDTAANAMSIQCGDGYDEFTAGTLRGEWGSWSQKCASPCGVCGIRTRVEHADDPEDNTGLNNVKLYCCKYGTDP